MTVPKAKIKATEPPTINAIVVPSRLPPVPMVDEAPAEGDDVGGPIKTPVGKLGDGLVNDEIVDTNVAEGVDVDAACNDAVANDEWLIMGHVGWLVGIATDDVVNSDPDCGMT
jgi:hypothetical protein